MLKAFTYMQTLLAHPQLRREEGQTMAEYAIVLAVITVAIIATLMLLSDGIKDALTDVKNVLVGANDG